METTDKNLKNETPEINMGANEPEVAKAVNNNLFKKSLIFAGAFVVILLVICGLQYCGSSSAKDDMSKADLAMVTAADSTQQADAIKMYNKIAEGSNADAAQRAKIISAGDAYEKGDYQAALNYIKGVDTKSPNVQALKNCLEGDCLINLDKTDDAIAAFEQAVKEANDNPELAPYALTKLANAYRYKGDYKQQLEVLLEIRSKFPAYNPQIDAEVARAEALAK